MSGLLNLINNLCAELRSDKLLTRNKAAEQLENHLSSSKNELLAQLPKRDDVNVSWTTIFNSAIDATIKHAIKLDEAKPKDQQTMRNKNYIFSAIVNKLINYNFEDREHLFSKSTLFNAFQEGFKSRVATQHFYDMFLSILNQGLFKSPLYIRELKLNEYSLVLSYLFETYKGNDELFRFACLRAITKTIELSHEHVQMSADVIAYFPEIREFATKAVNDGQKAEVIKLYYLMVSQHSVDYHNIICNDFQNVLPLLSGFYQYNMKAETKEIFFKSILISLQTLYPYIQQGDVNTINITLSDTWPKALKKLRTLVEIEIKERKISHYQLSRIKQKDKSLDAFVKMSALIIYLVYWHIDSNSESVDEETTELRSKISRPADKLNIILNFVQPPKSKYNEVWLSILAELITEIDSIINIANYKDLLSTTIKILQDYTNAKNCQCIRLLLQQLLRKEKQFVGEKALPINFCHEEWLKITQIILADTSSCSEVIAEKQLILQELISYKKFSVENCITLINSFTTNAAMRRSECVLTVQHILLNADHMGLDKTSKLVSQCITWLYVEKDKNEAKTILMNIEAIRPQLIAQTCALAVINFLDETTLTAQLDPNDSDINLQSLQFKYIRKYVCLEKYAPKLKLQQRDPRAKLLSTSNCLFQSNYELLMRTVNFETSQGTSSNDMLADLNSLQKISLLMKVLLEHCIFDEISFMQCPLIKRIGFFLSHLELQFKNNAPNTIQPSTLGEILNLLEVVIVCFVNNTILLQYLEKQPIDEMIQFLGTTLLFCSKNRREKTEFDDWRIISDKCLCLLANLCASSTHWHEAYDYISKYNFNISTETHIILDLTKLFCSQHCKYEKIGTWFVGKLKTIFKLYHTNIEIMDRIVEMIPAIFAYVQLYDDCLDDMLLAMSSLFKIAFRKSYSAKLTAKIINSICYIMRDCRNIYVLTNFSNLCLSIVNFLPFPSLDIQYAAINTLTALLDINWLKNSKCDIELYYEFCNALYESIKWKKLQISSSDAENQDQLQNSMALNVQLLVALLSFSCFNRENALQELSYVCALYKFTEADFIEFHRIAVFYNTSLKDLIKSIVPSAIHAWISKSYPILKYPFYLCYKTKNDFVLDNLELIVACLLLYGQSDDLQKVAKYADTKDVLKITMPVLKAFVLSGECPANKNDEIKKYVQNILKLKLDFNKIKSDNNSWKVMFTLFNALRDDTHSKAVAGTPIYFQTTKWYNIDYKCLQSALNIYVNNSTKDAKPEILQIFVAQHPLRLVKTFGALKKSCTECIYPIDSLQQFYKIYILSDMVLDALKNSTVSQNLRFYFVRDIIYYCLHCIESASIDELQKFALIVIDKITTKLSGFDDISTFMEKHLAYICKSLVYSHKQTKHVKLQQKISAICEYLLKTYKQTIKDTQYLQSLFANSEQFGNIMKMFDQEPHNSHNNIDNWKMLFELFIENTNYSLDSFKMLQQHIAHHKSDLQMENDLLYRLIRHLLEILRQTQNDAISVEALKCLGEIGPLNLTQMSFYFDAKSSKSEENNAIYQIEHFYECIYLTLEKLMHTFSASTHSYVIEVAQYLVNSNYGEQMLEKFPYFTVFRTAVPVNYLDTYDSIPPFDWLMALKACESLDYEKFICHFVSLVYAHCKWQHFHDLASNDIYFAEHSIIPFIQLLMQCEQKHAHIDSILIMLEHFFEEFQKHYNSGLNTETKTVYKEKRIANIILNICECIRVNNLWQLPLNLLNVAQACNYCQAYFLSIIYLEMWASNELTLSEKSQVEIASNDQFQAIARKAYDAIGCSDAISGFINPLKSRMDYLNLTNNWSDILIESTESADTESNYLCNAVLKRNGMMNLASSNSCASKAIDYEICWRLCRWDTIVEGHSKVNTLNDIEYEFEKHHFNALKCLHNKEENNTLAAINKSRHCVLNILKEISVECLQSVYKYLTWLQLLQQSEDFCQIQFSKSVAVDQIFNKWQIESEDLQYGLFNSKEMILSHQISLFQTAGVRANRKINEFYKDDPIQKCLLKCIHECKSAGEINLAKRYIATLNNMSVGSSPTMKMNALLEDVDICMKTGKSEMTKSILHHIFVNKEFQYCIQRVKAMQLNGKYLMDTNADTFETVLKKYFDGSLELLEKHNKSKDALLQKGSSQHSLEEFKEFQEESKKSAYEIIAKYADKEYSQLHTYANSDQFNLKRQILESNLQTAQTITPRNPDHDKRVCANLLKRTCTMDEEEIKLIENKLTSNLCIAVENYIKFACLDESISSPVIYRIIGLWFANKQNEALSSKVEEYIGDVPSYKFICALNQMTARLNSRNEEFIKILKEILIRCVQEHPHQTLYQLYSIVFGHIDGTENKLDYRGKIAQDIIARAKTKIDTNIVKQLETTIPVLIDFANTEFKDSRGVGTIPLSDKLKRLKNLDAMHCPTIELPVRVDQNYNITSILKWESEVGLVGGINAPKKLTCICSDGIRRPQLLKGKDDLRQDAVMQQVFSMINNLLKQEPEAVKRKLIIRTYKVVPLSTRSGILEWCQNTVPIGAYLQNAHKQYRPQDLTVGKCRTMAATQLKSSWEKRYEIYIYIRDRIKPVFHYFFYEKFLKPGIWFERRLAYINSVATTSMVGFILGLGDRHTQNILIDQKTAEIIHIDFGIAFEQGKIMPTPETVPFRLTRDMVAPMGISGPNGVFKKSCETTMEILRRHQDVITTILEVLLYDPLYIWKAIPQVNGDNGSDVGDNNNNEEKNYVAQRALLAVQNKLEGKQSGIFGTSSVSVQVERLINEAMNVRNLCMLFPGWDPYV